MSFGKMNLDPNDQLDFTMRLGADTWVQSTAYAVNDAAYNDVDGNYYLCVKKHTSTGSGTLLDDDLANWEEIEDGLWLKPGDTLTTVTYTLPPEVNEEADTTNDGYLATLWLTVVTPTLGTYDAVMHITTANSPNRITDRKFQVVIKEK